MVTECSDASATAAARKNFTRRSSSVPARLLAEGRLHLLPVYGLLTLSDLAREGIANSGSYRFADHLYANDASGRLVVGRWLDAVLLRLPAARAFRRRYTDARDAMLAAARVKALRGSVRILTVPCGIPRDVVDMARVLEREQPWLIDRIRYVGMDIDPDALDAARRFAADSPLAAPVFHCGDALRRDHYPAGSFTIVSSTGLGEFLTDRELATFHDNVYEMLEPGGTFYTSATARDRRSDLLLRMIELETYYRTRADLQSFLGRLPWRRMTLSSDPTGLQTFATVVK